MRYNPMRPTVTQVTVEYTARGQRVTKTFSNNWEARRFYAVKLKANADPRVVSAKLNEEVK